MTIGQAAEVSVPLLDLQAQYRPIRDEILAAVVLVCDSQRFILGPENAALESELAGSLEKLRPRVGVAGWPCRPVPAAFPAPAR